MDFVRFTGTREEAEALIWSIPLVLAGLRPDNHGIANRVKLRAGVALLSCVQQDFITKSRGGRGRDGIEWEKLKPETIANRRITRGDRRAAGVTGKTRRGFLTKDQDDAWKRRFRAVFRSAIWDVGEAEAKRIAAAAAWKHVKESHGAKTKVELFGNRQVDILRDTGELFRSLTPGVAYHPSGAEGQIFDVTSDPGAVTVGTNKKTWHQKGNRSRNLPARPMWPEDGIPDAWWEDVNDAIETGITEAVVAVMSGVLPS